MNISIIALQSLDGFLARSNSDDLSWGTREDKEFFTSKTKEIGVMIMGSTTFENMKGIKGTAFRDRHVVVMTSRPEVYSIYTNEFAKKVEFISGTPKDIVNHLETQGVRTAAIVGGSKVIQQFIASKLVNELFITIAPVIFGDGIPFCDGKVEDLKLELVSSKNISQNEVLLQYKFIH